MQRLTAGRGARLDRRVAATAVPALAAMDTAEVAAEAVARSTASEIALAARVVMVAIPAAVAVVEALRPRYQGQRQVARAAKVAQGAFG